MINTLKVYSPWIQAVELPLEPLGRAETDLIQIRNIEGLGPVNASVNTSPLGSLDGHTYVGSSVGARNIVLTIKPNPNWNTWTYEKLRQLLYAYFMPKKLVRLVFETDDFSPVEIFGYVESNEPQIFSVDGEMQISIICPYPYFTSIDPVVLSGTTFDSAITVDYEGTVESGVVVEMHYIAGVPTYGVLVRIGEELGPSLYALTTVDTDNYFQMSSIPGQKYVQLVNPSTGIITNILGDLEAGSVWPAFQPGENVVLVTGAGGNVADWTLTYYNRYGGL